MPKRKKVFRQFSLTLLYTLFVFLTMLVSMLLVMGGIRLLSYFGVVSYRDASHMPLALFIIVSLIVGAGISFFISRRPLKPWYDLTNAANEIADGNFSVRVHTSGPEAVQTLFNSFNRMAEELGSVEMLRSDFVNNFSHEFKTPIVSVHGFAGMLKRQDLTDEERQEYLDIIINETQRLADLADNVLNLSRLEQQTILTQKERFNLSEQIRLAVSVTAEKWKDKDVNISFDGGEVYVSGNKELLSQVWINLLDNSMKFTPDPAAINIRIKEKDDITVSVIDNGIGMSADIVKHMFDKFYQGDASHDTRGNGLGLPLVKRIIELHGGTVSVESVQKLSSSPICDDSEEQGKHGTVMTVKLPK